MDSLFPSHLITCPDLNVQFFLTCDIWWDISESIRIPVRVMGVSLCKGPGNGDRQSNGCAV
jgi:hypothetical protein